jgi:L-fuconate dehydratase
LLTDANQNLGDWRNAAAYMMELAEYKPLFIEEAIAYNDVLGYIRLREALVPAGSGVAGDEQAPDAITFKQMLAGGGLTHCQIDGARVRGVNELFAIIRLPQNTVCRYVRTAAVLDWPTGRRDVGL